MRVKFLPSLLVAAVLTVGLLFVGRGRVREWVSELTRPAVPSAIPYASATPTPTVGVTRTPTVTVPKTPVPATTAVNLDIPFVPQAPHQIWDEDHGEFCEEASALMAASYVTDDRTVLNRDVAEAALQEIKTFEMATFGYFKDTTAVETARILREHFNLKNVEVVMNPTEAQMKAWIVDGRAVLVPAAGRLLGNPNFKTPGPLYHMLVMKGFTANGTFITNDPGTRKGADYLYAPSVIMNAMHDWNGGDVNNGAKVVIVVG